MTRTGHELFEFAPVDEMLNIAEAIVRVFHRLGDYKHKQRNRLKFLVRSLGWDGFKAEFDKEYDGVRGVGWSRLPFDPQQPPVEEAPRARADAPTSESITAAVIAGKVTGPGHRASRRTRPYPARTSITGGVRTSGRQKQPGFVMVTVTTVLGDLTSPQLRMLGQLALAFSDGTVRITSDQNVVLRWVPEAALATLYSRLAAAGLSRAGASTLADVTSCPGAESCKLAVTQSRGLGRLLSDHLHERPDLVAAVPGLDIKISGCPNGCGQHHIAGIGFQGSLRKVGGRPAPHYFVMIGGGTAEDGTTFGRHVATVPARRWFEALERLVQLYRTEGASETPLAFFRRIEVPKVKAVARGSREADARSGRRYGLHRPRRGSRVQSRSDGRRMQRLSVMTMTRPRRRPDSVIDLIGRTPLLRLRAFGADTPGVELYAKAEFQNPGGSVKDRAAASILRAARAGRPPAARRDNPRRDVGQHRDRVRDDRRRATAIASSCACRRT